MAMRVIVGVLLVAMAFLAGVAWMRHTTGAAPPASSAPESGSEAGGAPIVVPPSGEAQDPGVSWTVPKRWGQEPERAMRLATYSIPAAAGDASGAECAVFYFGPQQGGGVDENISRWVGQFENASTPERTSREVGGMKVSRVRVSGAYLAPSGPMMESQGSRPGSMLLGAIVEGPRGAVFFKLTGPQKSVQAASKEFDAVLASMRSK